MTSHMLRLGRQTLVYGMSTVSVQLFGLITLPVVARVFTTSEYGVLELVTSAATVVGVFVDLGLASASQRSFYDYSDAQPEQRRRVLSTTAVVCLASAFILAGVLVVVRRPLAGYLFHAPGRGNLILIAALSLPLGWLLNFTREVMRLHFRVWQYLASSLVAGLLATAFVLVALLALHMKAAGVLWSVIVGGGVAVAYGITVVRHDVGGGFSVPELRKMLAYGLPLVPTALALWALALIDRLMLSRLSNLSQVGEYAMANRLALILTLGGTAFATAFAPFMLSLYAEDPEHEKVVRARALTAMGLAFAVVTVLVALFAREFFQVLAPKFDTAYEAVGLLCFGLATYGLSNIALGGISLARRTASLLIYSGIAAAANIGLNFLVIPAWGMLGAAVATAAAYMLLFGLYYFTAQRVYRTPYQLGRLVRLAAITAAAVSVGAIPIEPVALALVLKVAVFGLFLLSLRLTGVLEGDDLLALRTIVRTRRLPA